MGKVINSSELVGVPVCGGPGLYLKHSGKLKGVKTRHVGCIGDEGMGEKWGMEEREVW
jgi:hypothetical protein